MECEVAGGVVYFEAAGAAIDVCVAALNVQVGFVERR
jgi:hypothetical protein